MLTHKDSNCTIQYSGDRIILSGAVEVIHLEAEKILRRFAHSARPYEVKSDSSHRIVLAAAH
ncbi:MAG: hypothetical protein ACE5LB_08460 [Acidiferrobacterales bacterium]